MQRGADEQSEWMGRAGTDAGVRRIHRRSSRLAACHHARRRHRRRRRGGRHHSQRRVGAVLDAGRGRSGVHRRLSAGLRDGNRTPRRVMHEWDPRRLITEAETPASRTFAVLLGVTFVVLVHFVVAHHEPWRDEADPWLYVRDASLPTILARTRYVGLPALWFLCLAPLAKLGLPYFTQKILHLGIAAASVGLMAWRAPWSRLTKVLIAFSYYFAYEYSVIVRSYALTMLLMFAAAALYPHRRERPLAFALLLLLLFNCNAQGFFIAGTFAVLFVLERDFDRRRIAAIAIIVAAAIVAYLQVRTPPDPAREGVMRVLNRDAFAWSVSNAFLPTLPTAIGFVFGMALLLVVTLALRRSREAVLFLWMPLASLAILYSYVWLGGLRHAGFFLLLTLVAIWIGAGEIDRRWAMAAAVMLNLALLVSTVVGIRYAIADIQQPFTGAVDMASFIRGQHLEAVPIAAHNLTQAEAILPMLPGTKFWYAGLGEYGSYMKWDSAFERALNVTYPEAERRSIEHFRGRRWLLLFNVEIPDPASHGFRLLHVTAEPFEKTDERYWLYAPLQ